MAVTIWLDWLSGPRASMLLGYTVTVALAAWLLTRVAAITVAVALSAATGLLITIAPDEIAPAHVIWLNAAYRAGSLALNAIVVATLRNHLVDTDEALRHDRLTGARSRDGILDDLQHLARRAVRQQQPLSVVYLDLDGLKQVNDEQGHQAGDALIRDLVDHIRNRTRERDRLGRLGGDEFLLICPDTDRAGARNLVDRMMSGPEAPAVSWGITATSQSTDPDELVALADREMYDSKHGRKDTPARPVATHQSPPSEPRLKCIIGSPPLTSRVSAAGRAVEGVGLVVCCNRRPVEPADAPTASTRHPHARRR